MDATLLHVKSARIKHYVTLLAMIVKTGQNAIPDEQRRDNRPPEGEIVTWIVPFPNFTNSLKVAAVDGQRSIKVHGLGHL